MHEKRRIPQQQKIYYAKSTQLYQYLHNKTKSKAQRFEPIKSTGTGQNRKGYNRPESTFRMN